MITGEISSNLSSGQQCFLNDIKNFVKNGYLKSRNLSEEKKNHPDHKYSVTFVSKVGTITKRNLLSAVLYRNFISNLTSTYP